MLPLVSVIIPNYNHAQYLQQRIESVLTQTFQDFEIIILDDCSTDNSIEIIDRYRNHPKVSHIINNKSNSGSTFIQWNKGFCLAKGQYIWIAESDDFCEINMLELLVNKLVNHSDIVLGFTLSQFVNAEGHKILPFLKTRKDMLISGKKFISNFMISENAIHNASSAIFKKDCLSSIPSDYTRFKAAGDRLFWIEIAKQGKVTLVNSPLNYFRQHKIKVSPAKLIDGTTFKEDYSIYNLLKSQGYINSFHGFFVKNHYLNKVYMLKDMPDIIRLEMVRLWNNNIILPKIIVACIDYIYKKTVKLKIKLFI